MDENKETKKVDDFFSKASDALGGFVDSIEKRPEQEQRNIKTCLAQSWMYFRGYAPKLLARLSEVPSIAAYMSQLISQ